MTNTDRDVDGGQEEDSVDNAQLMDVMMREIDKWDNLSQEYMHTIERRIDGLSEQMVNIGDMVGMIRGDGVTIYFRTLVYDK